jgi:hypothetical protein
MNTGLDTLLYNCAKQTIYPFLELARSRLFRTTFAERTQGFLPWARVIQATHHGWKARVPSSFRPTSRTF